MTTNTISPDRDLTSDPFWSGILTASAGGPLEGAFRLDDACELGRSDESALDAAFDVVGLLDRCRGDANFCTMILQKFADRGADQLAALDRAAASRNARELARQAHTLTEIAANLSADRLAVCAVRLERHAAAGTLDRVAVLLESVHAEMTRCLQAMPYVLVRVAG
jgi:HPt (histidine-containing phosphotransfer) domain-containing protein